MAVVQLRPVIAIVNSNLSNLLKYACNGRSTLTFGGTYMKEPLDQTALFRAANLLSPSGIIFPI